MPVEQTPPSVDERRVNSNGRHPAISDAEYRGLDEMRSKARAANRLETYGRLWGQFLKWLAEREADSRLPVSPGLVAVYLLARADTLSLNTLELVVSAIQDAHRQEGFESPTKHTHVTELMDGLRREKRGEGVRQAPGLSREDLDCIKQTAFNRRRRGRGGWESEKTALIRGKEDIALIHTQFDGMLRASELVALRWGDVEYNVDGKSGVATIRESKTDQTGEGAVVWLSPGAMSALKEIRPDGAQSYDRIFPMSRGTAVRRIKRMGKAAGLDHELSGHSARVGMTMELVRAGVHIVAIMHAGWWKSTDMVPYYSRNMLAWEGAVAQWYKRVGGFYEKVVIARPAIAIRHSEFLGT